MYKLLFERRFSRWEVVFVIFIPVVLGQTHGGGAWLAAFIFGVAVDIIWGGRNNV